MKRGGPPERKTPLKQGDKGLSRGSGLSRGDKPLTRKTAMPRAAAKPAASAKPAKPKRAVDSIPAAIRALVLLRTDRCEACGQPFGAASPHLHHRRRRGPGGGGQHTPDNLVALHAQCHVVAPEAVHQRPDWARSRGLILRGREDPATTPVVLSSGRRVLLDPDGPFYLDAPVAA
jgi:5-methylcytosine-specific restriction endonuclease McrA